jgi:transposase
MKAIIVPKGCLIRKNKKSCGNIFSTALKIIYMNNQNNNIYYTYWGVSRKMKINDKLKLRLEMVNYADAYGISAAARYFKTDRKTVRKWYRRWKEKGMDGLWDLSRRPKFSPNKLSDEKIKKVIQVKEKFPTISTKRLAAEGLLPCSHETARKYAKQAGLIRKYRKKVRIKRKVALEFKQKLKPFELMQLDTKHLYDMPHYLQYMNALGLPKYEYTLRENWTCFYFLC